MDLAAEVMFQFDEVIPTLFSFSLVSDAEPLLQSMANKIAESGTPSEPTLKVECASTAFQGTNNYFLVRRREQLTTTTIATPSGASIW